MTSGGPQPLAFIHIFSYPVVVLTNLRFYGVDTETDLVLDSGHE